MGLVGGSSELIQRTGFQLANSLLGDTQLLAHFLERQRLKAVVQTESANNDLLFAMIQRVQDLLDLIRSGRLVDFR